MASTHVQFLEVFALHVLTARYLEAYLVFELLPKLSQRGTTEPLPLGGN